MPHRSRFDFSQSSIKCVGRRVCTSIFPGRSQKITGQRHRTTDQKEKSTKGAVTTRYLGTRAWKQTCSCGRNFVIDSICHPVILVIFSFFQLYFSASTSLISINKIGCLHHCYVLCNCISHLGQLAPFHVLLLQIESLCCCQSLAYFQPLTLVKGIIDPK